MQNNKLLMKVLTVIFMLLFQSHLFAQIDWQRTYIPLGKCYVDFPAIPSHKPNPNTQKDVYYCFFNKTLFMFSAEFHNEFQHISVYNEKIKENIIHGFTDGTNGAVKNLYLIETNYKDMEALDFLFTIQVPNNPFKYCKGRCILRNSTMYLFVYFYINPGQSFNIYYKFINSLTLIKQL